MGIPSLDADALHEHSRALGSRQGMSAATVLIRPAPEEGTATKAKWTKRAGDSTTSRHDLLPRLLPRLGPAGSSRNPTSSLRS